MEFSEIDNEKTFLSSLLQLIKKYSVDKIVFNLRGKSNLCPN